MRTRVASIVTLLVLVLLGYLMFQTCSVRAGDANDNTCHELELASNMISAALADEDCGGRIDLLKANVREDVPFAISLYDNEGNVLYAADGSLEPMSEADFATGTNGGEIYESRDRTGENIFCAVAQFEDGAFLRISAPKLNAGSILFSGSLPILMAALLIALMVYVFICLKRAERREKVASQVLTHLDEFTEGRFDKNIEPLTGKGADVEACNVMLERIQQRIVRQSSRNNEMSVIMNQMLNGMVAVDEELHIRLVTPVAKKLLGIIGNPDGKHINEASDDVRLDEHFKEAMKQNGIYVNEVAARTASGRTHRPLRLHISAMRNEGRAVGALAMIEDITETRKMEQVRADYAANVSHELKTPLTSIRGFLETLDVGAIDDPVQGRKFLRIIMQETERLTRLINDILSISKLESGDKEVSVECLRLDKMAYDVTDMLSIHATEKQVTLNCHKSRNPVYIIGNSDRVEQLLINLVENAIKYNNPGGSVTVQVFANDVNASLVVSDTGIGIPAEHLPHLFERFYRVDKGRSRKMGGTGLGLSIVKHIVRSMNGEIEVQSKPGEGTEFLITLPIAPREAQPETTGYEEE